MPTLLSHFDISFLLQLRTQYMVRRIGIGICLIVSSHIFELVIYFTLSHHNITNGTNATFVNGESEAFPLTEMSYLVRYPSIVIAGAITMEFCMAQAPCQVRGLVSAVFLLTSGIFVALYVLLHHYILIRWIFYSVRCVVTLVLFVIFLFVSKWYKLRKRDDVIPYHMFAEDQFESNYRQETNWLKDHGYYE